jgi:hypothetical protein
MNRRDVLRTALGVAVTASAHAFAIADDSRSAGLVPSAVSQVPQGGFAYLPEPGVPFSAAIVATEGFVLKRMRLRHPIPLEAGLAWMARMIKAEGRPLASLAGCELRIPERLTRPEFAQFNKRYLSALRSNGFAAEENVAIARSNAAPKFNPPPAPVLSAFTFAVPNNDRHKGGGPDFLVSGSPENATNPNRVIAPDDVSSQGMQQKASFVLQKLRGYVKGLAANWADITGCQIYTLQPLEPVMQVLQAAGLTEVGLSLLPAYIPVVGFNGVNYEFEVDVRSVTFEQSVTSPI